MALNSLNSSPSAPSCFIIRPLSYAILCLSPQLELQSSTMASKTPKNLDVDINKDVITGIASIALESVQGVVPVSPPLQLGEFFNGKRLKGINVSRDGDNVVVDLSVNVDYGRVIPDVAKEVQRTVAENIEVMTGLSVQSVNVTVQGVVLPMVANV